MIAFLKGIVDYVDEDKIYLDVNDVGYEVKVTSSVLNNLSKTGEIIKIYTFMSVREDDINLFGFISREELEIFKLLIKVNGIGPKGAIGILSSMPIDELRFAILAGDAKAISKAPGIGKKTAEKLILELKDKFDIDSSFISDDYSDEPSVSSRTTSSSNAKDAILALVSLGYTNTQALKAVKAVNPDENMSSEDIIKQALKRI